MSTPLKISGIVMYPHVFTPSAPRGTNTRRYSVQLLVAKNDPMMKIALEAQQSEIAAGFPSGLPANADLFIKDLALDQKNDPQLHDYYSLSFSTKEENGKPVLCDGNFQPLTNPSEVNPGDIVFISGSAAYYTVGTQGVKSYLNGLMTTGQKGSLPIELLSARPSAEQMFSTAAPVAPLAVPVAPLAAPVAPLAVPFAPATHLMTDKAAGNTYDALVAAGWTDIQLIQQGMMLPPSGVNTSFT